ncbi:MAG: HAD-IIIA family hydrolase [Burkholderiales bacterium]|jgi:phosphoglycolate phosphatase|nr:HAD-IIIA family hydrolase [Burkholderiales bacterium]
MIDSMPSNRPYSLLVFDWDGTIADSARQIVSAVQAAYRDLSLPPPDDRAASYIIGLRLDMAIKTLSPTLPPATINDIIQRYLYHYLQNDSEIPLFSGVRELLDELDRDGFLLAVATGKSRRGLDRMLRVHDLSHRFHVTRTADESFSKPNPAMLHFLMDRVGVAPRQTLMIGDTTHDVLMAKNAGITALAVTYGAHDTKTLHTSEPNAMVGSIAELRQWLIENAEFSVAETNH